MCSIDIFLVAKNRTFQLARRAKMFSDSRRVIG
jgi:hypothetical protein